MTHGRTRKSRKPDSRSRKAPGTAMVKQPVTAPAISAERAKLLAEHARLLSIVSLMPTHNAAEIVSRFAGPDLKQVDVIEELRKQCVAVQSGETDRLEATLVSQAHSLDVLFNKLAQRSASNMGGGYLGATETYMKLALRAQSQCRATLETLASIKNPSVVIAKQTNIAHGHQQVNNAETLPGQQTKIGIEPTELLENDDGQRLDSGTTGAAGKADLVMAAVGKLDGSENGRR